VRAARRLGAVFFLTYLACLAFLTLSWVMRSSLGLDRHFVVLVAPYATMAAYGIEEVAARVGALARRKLAAPIAASLLGAVALVLGWVRLGEWMRDWRGAIERGWPDRIAVGAYLRTLPPHATIFCDESTVEILSGLDRARFDRHWVDDPTEPERVEQAAAREGVVYVATWMRKLKTLPASGELVYRPPGETSDAAGLGVLRFGSLREER